MGTTTPYGTGTLTSWISPGGGTHYVFTPGPTTPSDARLKDGLEPIGSWRGLTVYSWRWSDAARARGLASGATVGLLAQDVREVCPEAVVELPSGYLAIDYAILEEAIHASC